ncbi:MAG: response regulator [Candidatus Marinimicrobia bacterium]|nr:response regulator [Candidatus Neomarinimicrobiota bacterium]
MNKIFEILVVDDDRSILEVLKIGIAEKGFKVDAYESAEEALKNFQGGRYRYALIDIKLQGMDGLELSQEIIKLDQNIVVILMTGYPDIRNVVEALRSRVFDYLIKPFRLSQLFAVLDKAEQNIQINAENLLLKKYVAQLKNENQELKSKIKKLTPMFFKYNENSQTSPKERAVDSYKKNQENFDLSTEDEVF